MEEPDQEQVIMPDRTNGGSEPSHPQAQAQAQIQTQTKSTEGERTQRHATLYDAVAGKVTYESSLSSAVVSERKPSVLSRPPKLTKHSVRPTALTPEEVVFRRKAAPGRFEEWNVYMAHERNLLHGGRDCLPDAHMLKAVHTYASHFYATLGGEQRSALYQVGARNIDERSMDETALIAFGILLEEAGRDILGARGDMVFTEGLESTVDDAAAELSSATIHSTHPPKSVDFSDRGSWQRASKRRKLTDPNDV
ncbi:hypothetical protein C8035_v011924 [Colletotrichum spinosum]|uniref:Uncharacterized protein n=1 Tax=Colletotrichum spinosum TaxID=1347390 RepID=A0A4R8Q5M8_9PEZI|nr:hypothetical protein C8035_v011924 [Colletotrichum spinosum]